MDDGESLNRNEDHFSDSAEREDSLLLTEDDSDELKDDHSSSWCQRVRDQYEIMGLSFFWYFMKWFLPGFCFALSFFIQNLCLHLGTYYYVQWMTRLEGNLDFNATEATFANETLSSRIACGSLHDMFSDYFGKVEVPMFALDMMSVSIPMVWFAATIYTIDLHLWAKCCLCGSLLALGKGFCAIATVVPDSTGWEGCKERLGVSGVLWFQDERNMQFENNIITSLWDLLNLEIIGVISRSGKMRHLRYCADMVYSGHTYFCVLFALGVYDSLRKNTLERGRKNFALLFIVGLLLMIVCLCDVIFILLNRFHYTLDVCMAVLLCYLYYTNAPLARAVDWWSDECWVPKSKQREAELLTTSWKSGEIMVPPCFPFPPFCLMHGRYFLTKENKEAVKERLISSYLLHNPETFQDILRKAIEQEKTDRKYPPLDLVRSEKYLNKLNKTLAEVKDAGKEATYEELMRGMHPDGNECQTIAGELRSLLIADESDEDTSDGDRL